MSEGEGGAEKKKTRCGSGEIGQKIENTRFLFAQCSTPTLH